jgi:hypothetical protein
MDACPHCGASLRPVHDAFCNECRQALDEPSRSVSASTTGLRTYDRRPVVGLLCGAGLGLLSGCVTMGAAVQSRGYVGASGIVFGQILAGALLGFVVGLVIRSVR